MSSIEFDQLKEELDKCRETLEQLKSRQSQSLARIYNMGLSWPITYQEMASMLQIESWIELHMHGSLEAGIEPEPEPSSSEPAPGDATPETPLDDLMMNLPTELQMLIFQYAGAWWARDDRPTLASWSVCKVTANDGETRGGIVGTKTKGLLSFSPVCKKWRDLIWNADGFLATLARIIVDREGCMYSTYSKRGMIPVDSALIRLCRATCSGRSCFYSGMVQGGLHLLIKEILNLPDARADVYCGEALIDTVEYGHTKVVEVLINAKQHPARANSSGPVHGFTGRHIRGRTQDLCPPPLMDRLRRGGQPGYALLLAAEKGRYFIVKLLLEAPRYSARADCFLGSAMNRATLGCHLPTLELLYSKWPRPFARRHKRSCLKQRVMLQCATSAVSLGPKAHYLLTWLLQQGDTDPDMPKADAAGGVLLATAAEHGHIETGKLLLGWKSNAPRVNSDAVVKAAAGGHNDFLMFLLSQKGSDSARADCNDGAALIAAVSNRRVSTVRLLLSWPVHAPRADVRDGAALIAAASIEDESKTLYSPDDVKAASVMRLLLEWPDHAPRAECQDGRALLAACEAIKEPCSAFVEDDNRIDLLFQSQHPPKANCQDHACLFELAERGNFLSFLTLTLNKNDAVELDFFHGWAFCCMTEGVKKLLETAAREYGLTFSKLGSWCRKDILSDFSTRVKSFDHICHALLAGYGELDSPRRTCSLCCRGGYALYTLSRALTTFMGQVLKWAISHPLDRNGSVEMVNAILVFCENIIALAEQPSAVRMDYGPEDHYLHGEAHTYEDFKGTVLRVREFLRQFSEKRNLSAE